MTVAQAPLHIVVSGTAGGVGTTTITALIYDLLGSMPGGAPTLADHSSGQLGIRLPHGDSAPRIDNIGVHDLGPHADGEGLDLVESVTTLAVIVTANTPLGLAGAERTLATIGARYGAAGLARVTVVAVGVFGPARTRRLIARLHTARGRGSLIVVPADPALAGSGPIPLHQLNRRTLAAVAELGVHLRMQIGLYRR